MRAAAMWERASRDWNALALPVLLATVFVLLALGAIFGPDWVPLSVLAVPVIAGGLALNRRRHMMLLLVLATLGTIALGTASPFRLSRPAGLLVVVVTGLVALALVTSRERLGVHGLRGESMLAELREQLRRQGEFPPLPRGWHAEIAERSAGGAGFAGDFLVSTMRCGSELELALVDVSGKGVDAGTRALLLSGALGGLLGSVPADEFLAAANAYVRRQEWDEGFATAVHLSLDLRTGRYLVDSAGHPPAAQFRAGNGQWRLVDVEGPALGLFDDAKWDHAEGVLAPGDALLLYTDGVVEVPGRDIALGIDVLLGEANRLVVSTFTGGAARVIDSVAGDATDDRALLLLWRA